MIFKFGINSIFPIPSKREILCVHVYVIHILRYFNILVHHGLNFFLCVLILDDEVGPVNLRFPAARRNS